MTLVLNGCIFDLVMNYMYRPEKRAGGGEEEEQQSSWIGIGNGPFKKKCKGHEEGCRENDKGEVSAVEQTEAD